MGSRIIVVGTAQDAGVPQIGCFCEQCTAARADPSRVRTGASIAIINDARDQLYLIDASLQIQPQLDRLLMEYVDGGLDALKGFFITHAHLGHMGGLGMLSKVSADVQGVLILSSPEACEYMRTNAPVKAMVARGNVSFRKIEPEQRTKLFDELYVTGFTVPHRPDAVKTYGFIIERGEEKILYIPDADELTQELYYGISNVDVALFDGTFYSGEELPNRDMSEIPHPLVANSKERLKGLDSRVIFTHINHTNPLNDPDSEATKAVKEAGHEVAYEFMEI